MANIKSINGNPIVVGTSQIEDNAVTSAKIATGAVGTTDLANSAVTLEKLANNSVNANKILDNAVTTAKIADNAVTGAKLAINAITKNSGIIASKAVDTAQISDLAITAEKVASNAIRSDAIIDGAVTAPKIAADSVDKYALQAGSVTGDAIAEGAVTGWHIDSGAVDADQLHVGAVTELAIASNAISTNKIQNYAVTTAKIADGSITAAKFAEGAIPQASIGDGAVTTAKLANEAVTLEKIAPGVISQIGVEDGSITTAKLADDAVTYEKLAQGSIGYDTIMDGAVGRDKLASNAVVSAKIMNSAVTSDKLGANAVSTAKIADGAVTAAKLGADSVSTVKIVDGAVTTAKVADLAVTEGKLAANAVTTDKIYTAAVTSDKIADGAITSDLIASGAVGPTKLAANAVYGEKILSRSISGTKIAINTVATENLADGSVTSEKILNQSVGSAELANDAVITRTIADDAVTTAKIIDGAVTDAKLAQTGGVLSEVHDIRMGADGTTYSSAGDAVRSQISGLRDDLDFTKLRSAIKGTIVVSDVEDGYYSSVNGKKLPNSESTSYKRSPYLIPVDEKSLYVANLYVRAACFDASGTYISTVMFYPDTAKNKKDVTPIDTAFVGLYATNATGFTLRKVDSSSVTSSEYPYTSDDYLHIPECWCNGSGTIASTTSFDMLVLANVKAGDRYYVSNNATYNMICFDVDGEKLSATYESVTPLGRIFTVPEGTVLMHVNLYRARTTGTSDDMADYVAKLNGKSVLAIGDSITWLDGRQNYGGAAYMSGWQRQLRLAGYKVVSAGYSGYPYATGLNVVDGVDHSIYQEIVTNEYSVTGYDYVILFGGTNDVLYGGDVGTRGTDYANRTFDASKFNGALSAIISYIRTNNTTAKILLASFPKSEAVSRTYSAASSRVAEIKYNADFWSCKYVDIFADMNVQPTYDGFDLYFYDSTHPNYAGMQLIGGLMFKALEAYE